MPHMLCASWDGQQLCPPVVLHLDLGPTCSIQQRFVSLSERARMSGETFAPLWSQMTTHLVRDHF